MTKRESAGREKKNKITAGKIISAVILVCIILALYLPQFSTLANNASTNNLTLPFIPSGMVYDGSTQYLQDYAQSTCGVPGYSANVYVIFNNSNVAIGDTVNMQIIIKDTGNTFHNAYFYAFIVNSTGSIVSTFPDPTYLSTYQKLPQWYSGTQTAYWVPIYQSDGTLNNNLIISRPALLSGAGAYYYYNSQYNSQIWLEQKIYDDPSQIGQWSVWVFVFDDQYLNSMGNSISSNNAITYTKEFFNVTPKALPKETNTFSSVLPLLAEVVSLVLLIISTYGLVTKVSPWIDSRSKKVTTWWRTNRRIVSIIVVVAIAYLILIILKG